MCNKKVPISDRIGERHKKLIIRDYLSEKENGKTKYYFLCDCDCGKKNVKVRYENIIGNDGTGSCGCSLSVNSDDSEKNISYDKRYNVYIVRVKGKYIGSYKDKNIAIEMRNKARENCDHFDEWFENERVKLNKSLNPQYTPKKPSEYGEYIKLNKEGKYELKISKGGKEYFIGSFKSLDIAKTIKDKVDFEDIENWVKTKREQVILSLVPDYIFAKKRNKYGKSIFYNKYNNRYYVQVTKNRKTYNIGTFIELDIAEKVRDKAYENFENIENWMKTDRAEYIHSLVPDYKIKNSSK